jgi:hypothetical protein
MVEKRRDHDAAQAAQVENGGRLKNEKARVKKSSWKNNVKDGMNRVQRGWEDRRKGERERGGKRREREEKREKERRLIVNRQRLPSYTLPRQLREA